MKVKNFMIALLGLFIAFQANAQGFKKVVGNDNYVTRAFQVNDFSKISVANQFNIIYKVNPDSAGYIRIYAEENIQDIVSLKSTKGTLSISLKNGVRIPEFGVILMHVYSSSLTEVDNVGAATFEVQSMIDEPEITFNVVGDGQIKAKQTHSGVLNINVSGGGDVLVAGSTGMGDYSIQGSGEIRAADVAAEEVKAVITGSGKIKCHAEKELKTILTGNGKVEYTGTPALKTRTVGTGQVIAMD